MVNRQLDKRIHDFCVFRLDFFIVCRLLSDSLCFVWRLVSSIDFARAANKWHVLKYEAADLVYYFKSLFLNGNYQIYGSGALLADGIEMYKAKICRYRAELFIPFGMVLNEFVFFWCFGQSRKVEVLKRLESKLLHWEEIVTLRGDLTAQTHQRNQAFRSVYDIQHTANVLSWTINNVFMMKISISIESHTHSVA